MRSTILFLPFIICVSQSVHIVPYSYDVTVKLPVLESEFTGSLQFHFALLAPSSNITLHAKDLSSFNNITLLCNDDIVEPKLKAIRILADTVEFTFNQTLPRTKYLLSIGEYTGKLRNDSLGIFQKKNGVIATHFQPAFARTFVPCIDLPYVKSSFRLSVIHPSSTVSQSNTIATDVHIVDTNWQKTVFAPTPNLPAYLLSLSVMPDSYVQLSRQTSFGVTLRVNAASMNASLKVLDVAVPAFEVIATMLQLPLPLNKVDFILVPDYFGGIENWGHVIVSDELGNTTNEAHLAYVVAHELIHHWIGDKVTINSWKWICLQEDLTDYLSYKVVRSLLNGDERYERFRLSKYVEIQLAEDFVSKNHSLEMPEEIDMEMITNHCYLKGVIFLESLEAVTGENAMISILRQLIDSKSTFDLDLFADYFQNYTTADGVPLSQVYQFWYRTGGYPEVLIQNTAGSVTVAQRGPKVWPVHLPNAQGIPPFLLTAAAEYPTKLTPVLVNLNFTSFLRVNYDPKSWTEIFKLMSSSPNFFSSLGRAQLTSDFCYFHSQGLIPNGTVIKSQVLDMVYSAPENFELCDWNLYWCTYSPDDSVAASLVKRLLVNFSTYFRDDIQYGCKRGGAAKTINNFCITFFGKTCL